MPVLKQLECHIELNGSNIALREYNTVYHDGFVETFVPVPTACPDGFNIHLTSSGYIAPGLAMFVFMDGMYQCNRNRQGLIIPDGNSPANQTEVDFRVRQKEERQVDGNFVGRAWKFERLNIASADASSAVTSDVLSNIGTIEVVVLRCKSRDDEWSFTSLGNSPLAATDNGVNGGSSKNFVIRKSTAKVSKAASIVAASEKGSNIGGLFGLFDGSADEMQADGYNELKIGLDGGYPEHFRQHSQQHYNGAPYWVPTGPNQGYYYPGGGAGDWYPPNGGNGAWHHPANPYDEYGNRRDVGNAVPYRSTNPYNPYDEFGNRRDIGEYKVAGQSSRTTSIQGGSRDHNHLAGLDDAFGRKGYSTAKWEPPPRSPSFHLYDPRYAPPEPNPAYQANLNGSGPYPQWSYPNPQSYIQPAQQHQSYQQWQGMRNAHSRKPSPNQSAQGPTKVKKQDHRHDKNRNSSSGRGQSNAPNEPKNKETGNDSKKVGSNDQPGFRPPSPQSENATTPLSNNQAFQNRNQDWQNSGPTMRLSDWREQNQASGGNDNTSGNPGNGGNRGQDNSGNNGNSNWQNGNAAGDNWAGNENNHEGNNGSGNDPTGNDDTGNDGWDNLNTNNGNAENATWETNGNQEADNGGDTNWGANENQAGASNSQAWDTNNAIGNVADSKTNKKRPEGAFSRGSKSLSSKPHPTVTTSATNSTQQCFIKPYWSTWDKQQTSSDTSTVRRRAETIYIAPEEPLYSVPKKVVKKNNTTHQVQAGKGAMYAHAVRRPAYMDSLSQPYAVFAFKYRSKEILEKMLGINIKEHPDDFKKRMMGLSKEEIVEELMKVKARAGSAVEGDDDNDENNKNDENDANDDETPSSENTDHDTDDGDNNGGNTAWDAQNNNNCQNTAGKSAGDWNNSGGEGGDADWNTGGGGANTAWDAQNDSPQQAAANSAGDWPNSGGGGGDAGRNSGGGGANTAWNTQNNNFQSAAGNSGGDWHKSGGGGGDAGRKSGGGIADRCATS